MGDRMDGSPRLTSLRNKRPACLLGDVVTKTCVANTGRSRVGSSHRAIHRLPPHRVDERRRKSEPARTLHAGRRGTPLEHHVERRKGGAAGQRNRPRRYFPIMTPLETERWEATKAEFVETELPMTQSCRHVSRTSSIRYVARGNSRPLVRVQIRNVVVRARSGSDLPLASPVPHGSSVREVAKSGTASSGSNRVSSSTHTRGRSSRTRGRRRRSSVHAAPRSRRTSRPSRYKPGISADAGPRQRVIARTAGRRVAHRGRSVPASGRWRWSDGDDDLAAMRGRL